LWKKDTKKKKNIKKHKLSTIFFFKKTIIYIFIHIIVEKNINNKIKNKKVIHKSRKKCG